MEFRPSKSIKICLSEEDWAQIAAKDVIKSMCRGKSSFAYDILQDNAVVGFALFRSFGDGVFLWQYAIAEGFQRQGYGYAALKGLVEKISAEKGVTYFVTTYKFGNLRAQKLYEKLGFKQTDIVDEEDVHEVNMELFL